MYAINYSLVISVRAYTVRTYRQLITPVCRDTANCMPAMYTVRNSTVEMVRSIIPHLQRCNGHCSDMRLYGLHTVVHTVQYCTVE